MADKYVGLEQYKRSIDSIKNYIDKSIPCTTAEAVFILPSDKVLEIYNSDTKTMEFDKPSVLNLDSDFVVNYNNKDINTNIMTDAGIKYILCNDDDNNISIAFVLGVGANENKDENKMVVVIETLNTNITITDVVLKRKKIKYLNNKYLKSDVIIRNSLTIGSRKEGHDIGLFSFSNGDYNIASGWCSHAEGYKTEASGCYSHAEGSLTIASGRQSHAEGRNTKALQQYSHAEGQDTTASGTESHAEGYHTTASGNYSHAEGCSTIASGTESHAEGYNTTASGESSHAEGNETIAKGRNQHVEGKYNIEDTANAYAHIVGNGSSTSERSNAHTLDWSGNAWYAGDVQANNVPHVVSENVVLTVPAATITENKTEIDNANIGNSVQIPVDSTVEYDPTKLYYLKYNNKEYSAAHGDTGFIIMGDDCKCGILNREGKTQLMIATLDTTNITDLQLIEKDVKKLDNIYLPNDLNINNSITVGIRTGEIGRFSSSFGANCEASGNFSHAEGSETIASSENSHAEGIGVNALGYASHAEGYRTTASGDNSHAEGSETIASGVTSHTEGQQTTASGNFSHAEGASTTASGNWSHAEGSETTASGDFSHAEGASTTASGNFQHVQGKYNIEDTKNKYAHIVGNGSENKKSNAHTLDWSGNAWYAGSVYTGGTSQDDANAKKLATEDYVNRNKVSKTSELTNDSGFITREALHDIVNYIDEDINDSTPRITYKDCYAYTFNKVDLSSIIGTLRIDIQAQGMSEPAITYSNFVYDESMEAYYAYLNYNGNIDEYDRVYITTNNSNTIIVYSTEVNYAGAWTHVRAYAQGEKYASVDYVNNSISSIVVPTKTSDLTNDSGFITSIPGEYITEEELTAKNYIDNATLESKGYLTEHQDISGLALKSELHTHTNKAILDAITSDKINSWDSKSTFSGSYKDLADKPTIPTKTSQLTNDSGYLTEHQSLVGLATETYVNGKISDLVNSSPATLDTLKELADALGNDPNFATTVSNQIGNKVDKVSGKGLSTNDLTSTLKANYDAAYNHSKSAHAPSNAQKNSDITKAEIEAKLTGNITTHTHSQYLTSIPSEYITEQELTSKGYATESQINSAVEAAATTHEEVKTTVNQILGGAYIE